MRRASLVIGTALLLTAGCSAGGDQSRNEAIPSPKLVALASTDVIGRLAREPMIAETADGDLILSGYDTERPMLWRSSDGGISWDSVDIGTEADGAFGNSDVDLAVGPEGTLYMIVMSFDLNAGEGNGVAVAASRDGGSSWFWTSLSRHRFDDRPWVEVAPNGTAHAIWNDGAGVRHAVSNDRGSTWTEGARVFGSGGSSHFAISPTGTLAIRLTPLSASGNKFDATTDYLATSRDGGESWTLRDLPGTRVWIPSFDPSEGVLRWVEPVAWDSTGALFLLWSEGRSLWLARSSDQGATWTRWPVAEDSVPLYFPYLVAHGDGQLAATWFAGVGNSLQTELAVIQLDAASADRPRILRARPFQIPAFRLDEASGSPIRDTAGDYVAVAFLHDGRIAVASVIQDPAANRWGFTFRSYRIE